MADKHPEHDLNQKMMQFQLLQNNFQSLRQQLENGAMRLEELTQARLSLENLDNAKSGDTIFLPMGAGNFIDGKIGDVNKVLVSIGGEAAVKRKRTEALEILDKKLEDVKVALDELYKQEQRIVAELNRLQPEIQVLMEKAEKK